jgi:hypothetical protein
MCSLSDGTKPNRHSRVDGMADRSRTGDIEYRGDARVRASQGRAALQQKGPCEQRRSSRDGSVRRRRSDLIVIAWRSRGWWLSAPACHLCWANAFNAEGFFQANVIFNQPRAWLPVVHSESNAIFMLDDSIDS